MSRKRPTHACCAAMPEPRRVDEPRDESAVRSVSRDWTANDELGALACSLSMARLTWVRIEQVMQIAIDVAGFTPAESDELRQAMGSKRSQARMAGLQDRLYAGMAANDIVGAVADEIFEKLHAFASFGFPGSHSISFARWRRHPLAAPGDRRRRDVP